MRIVSLRKMKSWSLQRVH